MSSRSRTRDDATSCFHLLTSCMKILILSCSRTWRLPKIPKGCFLYNYTAPQADRLQATPHGCSDSCKRIQTKYWEQRTVNTLKTSTFESSNVIFECFKTKFLGFLYLWAIIIKTAKNKSFKYFTNLYKKTISLSEMTGNKYCALNY